MDVKERIYENAKALAKMKGIKLSDIEKQIGAAVGYLSRKSRGLTIEKAYEIARILQVSLTELTENDYWEVYKKQFAEDELKEAVNRAKNVMNGCDILEIVNDVIDGR